MGPDVCMVFPKAPHRSLDVSLVVQVSFLARATTTDPIFSATSQAGSMTELSSYRTKAETTWGALAQALAGRSEHVSCSQSNSQRCQAFAYHDHARMLPSSDGCAHTKSRLRRSHHSKQQRPHREEQQSTSSGRLCPGIARALARASLPRGGVAAAHFGWLLHCRRRRRDGECQRPDLWR